RCKRAGGSGDRGSQRGGLSSAPEAHPSEYTAGSPPAGRCRPPRRETPAAPGAPGQTQRAPDNSAISGRKAPDGAAGLQAPDCATAAGSSAPGRAAAGPSPTGRTTGAGTSPTGFATAAGFSPTGRTGAGSSPPDRAAARPISAGLDRHTLLARDRSSDPSPSGPGRPGLRSRSRIGHRQATRGRGILANDQHADRSEERRVGKECTATRARGPRRNKGRPGAWWPDRDAGRRDSPAPLSYLYFL